MAAKPEEYGPKAGVLAPLPACERGVATVTGASPDGKLFIYSNGSNVVIRDMDVRISHPCSFSCQYID